MIAKIIVLPLWAIFGVIVVTIPVLCYILLIFLLALFGGPCEFTMKTIDRDTTCCTVLMCLLFPFIYLAGIPVFFFGQCNEIC